MHVRARSGRLPGERRGFLHLFGPALELVRTEIALGGAGDRYS